MFFARFLTAAGVIAAASADLLPKGGLYGPADALRQAIHDKMEAMPGSVVRSRNPVGVPAICNEITSGWGVNEPGSDQTCEGGLEAMEVQYDDCDQPWTLCRCANANLGWDALIDRVGKVPPAARSYVRVFIAIHAGGCSGLCFNGEIIRLNGDCDQFVVTHEVGHAVDKGYPEWQPFLDGVNRDSCVADEYGNNNLAENFAQMFSLVTSTWFSGSVDRDIGCLQGQFNTLWNDWRIREALGAPSCLPERRPALFAPNSAKFASSLPSKEVLNVTLPSGPQASLHHEQFTFHRYY